MHYQSPFGILSSFVQAGERLVNLDFTLLKKRIFAEFELAGKTTIENNGKEFSKNDYIQWFENVRNNKDFECHLMVFDLPELLNLLENNDIKKEISFIHKYYQNKDFVAFISPYLAESLGLFLSNQIRNKLKSVKLEYQTRFPILNEHEQILIEPVALAIGETVTDIRDMCAYFLPNANFPDTRVYFSDNLIKTIGTLPIDYFSGQIDSFVNCGVDLIQFLVKPTKSGIAQLSTAKYIQKQLLKLKLGPEIKKKIQLLNIPKEVLKNKEVPQLTASDKGCLNTILIVFLIAVAAFFRWICKGSNNEDKSIRDEMNVHQNTIILSPDSLKRLDSVLDLPEITIKPK